MAAIEAVLLGTTTPTVILLEDLHWCDPDSMDVLRRLTPQLADRPLLLVASTWYLVVTSILMVGQFYLERYFSRGASRKLTSKQLEALARAQMGDHGGVPA